MNILFLTMTSGIRNIDTSGIYTDLMRKFREEGHNVYIIYPLERRLHLSTDIQECNNMHFLGVKTLNLTKTNSIEKGIGQILLEYQFKRALKRFWDNISFDIILYSTPPITFTKIITNVKRKNPTVVSYLLLKDIFPQNALDLGMLSNRGVKGLIYRHFRAKEKELYRISDYIGCMSPANVDYVLTHNPEICPDKVEVAPNSYSIFSEALHENIDSHIKKIYNLPSDRPIFIYGGNMGKPQGIPFMLECLNAVKNRTDCHFVIIGNGTEYHKIDTWYRETHPSSISLFQGLPKDDYDRLAKACDVGLIFLDYRFTIPNYPSRLLPYLMAKKPIVAATDSNSDVGVIAESNGYGYWCPSNSVDAFVATIEKMLSSDIKSMGENGYQYYRQYYTVENTYKAITAHL